MLKHFRVIILWGYNTVFREFENDSSEDINNEITEATIKSYAFLFGIYFDIKQENVLKVAFVHLILTILII